MIDHPDQATVEAVLDDLARIAIKHGVVIDVEKKSIVLKRATPDIRAYASMQMYDVGDYWGVVPVDHHGVATFTYSFDISSMSAHEKMAIKAGRD